MAVYTSTPTVGTTATLLTRVGAGFPGYSVAIYNPGPTVVLLGNASVTATTGFSLLSGSTFQADLGDNETLYGIVATGTQAVQCLETGA